MKNNMRIPAIVLGALWMISAAWAQVAVPKRPQPAPAAKTAPARPAPAKATVPAAKPAVKPEGKPSAHAAAARHREMHEGHAAVERRGAERQGKAPAARAGGRQAPEEMESGRPRVVHRVRRPTRPPRKVERKDVGKNGQRDPFVSPVVERGKVRVACTGTGRQCLEVSDLVLQGVVKGPSGFIAVVVNGEHTYFLREGDPLANGDVEKITGDTIQLRERFQDDLGRSQTRQVVRKVTVPAV
ncbi:MAG: hypothetical protein P4M01_13905 [Acidobacteriota bacterium]|nr:hypothetical protein [Acidobacteriota bacterium]